MPDTRSGSRWLRRLAVPTLLAGLLLVVPGTAQAQSCSTAVSSASGAGSDFDGDGKVDLAISDPDATVSGNLRAGRVHIAYGDDATQTIVGGDIPGYDSGAGERFGFALDSVDWNKDGCTDLIIGNPYEHLSNNTILEAGSVVFIPGSPAGLDKTLAKNWTQSSLDGATGIDINEAGDRFGWDVAAGLDTAGKPFLVVGSPGEAAAVGDDGGYVFYARPGKAVAISQNIAGYSDSFEAGDMFGYSVAASESGLVIGVPGESAELSAGTVRHVGTVFLVGHNDATVAPSQITAWGQDSPGISGGYEHGDRYGYALDMVDYISTGGGATRMMIAVGAPGEAIGSDTSSGMSSVIWSPGTGFTEYKNLSQDADKNTGDSTEPGDAFGIEVAMVNRTPGQNTTTDTLLLAIGSPGEDVEDTEGNLQTSDAGQVGLFSMTETEPNSGDLVRGLLEDAGLAVADGNAIGSALYPTRTHLWATVSSRTDPVVYGVPWDNIVAAGTAPVLSYTPTTFGLSNTDVVSFGASLA
ncbi:hypothetical protein O1R50_11605 [Glycomyces luteolus]|uniref:FG-GAP repeat protein n=1 Tax=Glycomyces luteolus TaxID=2670330 RepID=A0A9X3P7N6_9ACTN|nr:hypothetical protein [Glycomyces luteolus]MDA1360273.1 hypothetical protein [Glycomyces luteolus]